MKIGLYFGSFNPFHVGHKIIASYIRDIAKMQQVWFVVSPQSPMKIKKSLLDQHHRLMIIKMEIEDNINLDVSDIEFSLPTPNYTIDTLIYLKEKYPSNNFSLIMGDDNLNNIKRWKNYDKILENYLIYVYPRKNVTVKINHKNINFIKDVPKIEISSSLVRKLISENKDASYLVPEKSWRYIEEMNFYKK
tara:strand:+ start:1388 stop:1960 length:573 start_codon:yes stop_codon:yes gene_type:complete